LGSDQTFRPALKVQTLASAGPSGAERRADRDEPVPVNRGELGGALDPVEERRVTRLRYLVGSRAILSAVLMRSMKREKSHVLGGPLRGPT